MYGRRLIDPYAFRLRWSILLPSPLRIRILLFVCAQASRYDSKNSFLFQLVFLRPKPVCKTWRIVNIICVYRAASFIVVYSKIGYPAFCRNFPNIFTSASFVLLAKFYGFLRLSPLIMRYMTWQLFCRFFIVNEFI